MDTGVIGNVGLCRSSFVRVQITRLDLFSD